MRIPRRPRGPIADAVDAIAALAREAESVDLDPLDRAMLDALEGLADVMGTEGKSLDALRRRVVRLGQETLG